MLKMKRCFVYIVCVFKLCVAYIYTAYTYSPFCYFLEVALRITIHFVEKPPGGAWSEPIGSGNYSLNTGFTQYSMYFSEHLRCLCSFIFSTFPHFPC